MGKTTNKKATVNFANMDAKVLIMLSNCQYAITALSELEKATDAAKAAAKKKGLSGQDLKDAIKDERKTELEARSRATDLCDAFIFRNMSIDDITNKDFDAYHLDWQGFLKNIGVISDGELDKKATNKFESIVNKAVDRYKMTAAGRKRGTNVFTDAERKDVKNTKIDLVSAFVAACVDSKAIEYSGGGLAKVDFSKKADK